MRVGLRGVGLLGFGNLDAQARQLGVQRRVVLLRRQQGGVARRQLARQLLQFGLAGCAGVGGGRRQQLGTKLQGRLGPCRRASPVMPSQPERHLKQLLQHRQRVRPGDGPRAVRRAVALAADHVHLRVQRRAHQQLEARLKQKGRQIRLVRHAQRAAHAALGPVQPGHRQLQRAPRVKAGRARVGVAGRLTALRLGQQLGPAGLQKGESWMWSCACARPRACLSVRSSTARVPCAFQTRRSCVSARPVLRRGGGVRHHPEVNPIPHPHHLQRHLAQGLQGLVGPETAVFAQRFP